jgi:hypothetical protein
MDFANKHPSQDRPLSRSTDDKLERGPFIGSLVRTLVRDNRDNDGKLIARRASGFVVGLTGKWGSGKSSVLRLLELELGSMDRVIVSYFNPWLFNGRDELVRGFFSGLREAMGRSSMEQARELASALDRYWGSVDLAGQAVAAVADAHGAGGAASTFWNKLNKSAKKALPKSKNLSPELERLALEKKISSMKLAVVVLIDELDRLEDDEVKAVAQLVKAVGDIEGLSYLVAYDPDRVTEALGRGEGPERQTSGARYLEKIIQLPIPLRPLFGDDKDALLQAELRHHDVVVPTADAENQQTILAQIMQEISTPRDIKRLVGAFSVLELATRGEIEPVDVLAYAWILTKSPALRDVLAERFEFLVSDPIHIDMFSEIERTLRKDQKTPKPEDILGPISAAHREILTNLFPRFRDVGATDDTGTRLHRRRNIVRLLYLGNPPGAFSRSEIELVWNIGDADELQSNLKTMRTDGRLAGFIDRLDDFIMQLPSGADRIFWPNLAKVLTRSSDWVSGDAPEYSLVNDIATMILKLGLRDNAQKPRVKSIISALIESGDLAVAPQIVRDEMYAQGLSRNKRTARGDVIYSELEFKQLLSQETRRYMTAVLDGTALRRQPSMSAIYVIKDQNLWNSDLRTAMTNQLKSRDAISTIAALILPPGYGTEQKFLTELFDLEAVVKEIDQINFDAPPLEPWIANAVQRLRFIISGQDPFS